MHSRTAEQSAEEGFANPLRFFANLLNVYDGARLRFACPLGWAKR